MKLGKSFFYRAGAILFLIIVAVLMLIIGRGHTIYFDNKTLEYEGKTYDAPYKIEVNVKNNKVSKLYAKERGSATIMGQNLKMELTITQTKGGSESVSKYKVKVPYGMDGIVINLPAYLAGLPQEAYLSEFVSLAVTSEDSAADEVVFTDEMGGGF